MAIKKEPEPHEEWLKDFNLMHYQFRLLNHVISKDGATPHEVTEAFGSWYDMYLRGLVIPHSGILRATALGSAFFTALTVLATGERWIV